MKLTAGHVSKALEGVDFVGSTGAGNSGAPDEACFSRVEIFVGQPVEDGVLYAVDGQVPNSAHASQFLVAAPSASADGAFGVVRDASAAQAVNLVAGYLARAEECAGRMRRRYYGERDLQGLCQELSDFVGNPVLAYDDTLLPVAQTEFPREFATERFGSERLDRDYVFRTMPNWSRDANTDVFAQVGARLTINDDDASVAAVCNVHANGQFQGWLEIFQVNSPICAADMRMLEVACDIVSAPFPFDDNSFLLGKLKGRATSAGLAESWLSSLRWRASDGIYVIAIELPATYVGSQQLLEHSLRMMRSLLPGAVSAQMDGMPVYVANDRLLPRRKALQSLASFLDSVGEGAHAGASEVMCGIGHLHEGYAHAQFAARFASAMARPAAIARFEECLFAFFTDLCRMDENRNLVVDGAVARMHDDDLMSGSENTLTAKTYIETGFNLAATASTLSVHRNTVAYRLKHIAGHYGIDLSAPIGDGNLVFQVLLSCKLLLNDA